MLNIELESELEITLNAMAQNEQSSPSELIKRLINRYIQEKQRSELLLDIVATLPVIACFKEKAPLSLQKAMLYE